MSTMARVCIGVAHEFNNLLAVTQSKTELLESLSSSDPIWVAHLQDLREGCGRGAKLVKQLMTFYERKERKDNQVDAGDVLSCCIDNLHEKCGSEIKVVTTFPAEPLICQIGRQSLERILTHVIENAAEAMPSGGAITIETQTDARCLSYLKNNSGTPLALIRIKDQGCGIAESLQSRIFEPFFTTKKGGAGNGLGLSVVSNLVRENGGWIEFESEEGIGTEFRIYLPKIEAQIVNGRNDETTLSEIVDTAEVPERASVLIVDDESVIRFSLSKLLEAENHIVQTAEDGESGLALLQQPGAKFDLIITDMCMPGMSGQELANCALHTLHSVGIILMSGFGAGGVDQDWLEATGARFIAKPFDRASLMKAIASTLRSPSKSALMPV